MRTGAIFRLVSAVAGILALTALGTVPAQASPASAPLSGGVSVLDTSSCTSTPTVNDFVFESFEATYRLGRDDAGRSTLRTVEELVAVFPDFDQNRGIRRDLVSSYQGHDTGIQIVSVTDGAGNPRPYSTETSVDANGESRLSLTIALPCGQFAYGEQTYRIEYTQRDVTAYFADRDEDEFYWDTNGAGWGQPFGRVAATVELDPELVPALTDGESCYRGYAGSTERCEITRDGAVVTAQALELAPYQNMTVVVAFQKGTFAGPPWWSFIPILPLIAGLLVLGAIVFAFVTRFVTWRDARGRGIVIAQYEPPAGVSALLAANIVGKPRRGMAAAIVDLAVRGNVRILEHDQGWSRVFGVQRVGGDGLGPDEQRVMGALFSVNPFTFRRTLPGLRSLMTAGGQAAVPTAENGGEVRWLTKGDSVLGQQVVALTQAVAKETEAGALRRKPSRRPLLVVIGALVLAMALLILQLTIADDSASSVAIAVVGVNTVPWLAVPTIGVLTRRRPLTARGAELKEHLDGLKEFIRLAEADRLQMLQSVSGAKRVTTGDGGTIVKIYERLLPYAVLFGLEEEWAREISKYYDETPPDWYSGSSGFHAATFAAGIGALSSSVSTSFSGSSSGSGSSSSGGGGGGGSSGGGGGGGGGGGV